MTNKTKIALWITKDLKARLKKYAGKKHWSMSLANEIILKRYLEKVEV